MLIERKEIITKEELETNLKEANIKIKEAYHNGYSFIRELIVDFKSLIIGVFVIAASFICAMLSIGILFGIPDWLATLFGILIILGIVAVALGAIIIIIGSIKSFYKYSEMSGNDFNEAIVNDIKENTKAYETVVEIINQYLEKDYNLVSELLYDKDVKSYKNDLELIKEGLRLFESKNFMVFKASGFDIKNKGYNFKIKGMVEAFKKLENFKENTKLVNEIGG